MSKYYCNFLNNFMTILCDGNVTCGLDDPYSLRSFGNVKMQSVQSIWNNVRYNVFDYMLNNGKVCHDCSLYSCYEPNQNKIERDILPKKLIIEPTILCNINCLNSCCQINNDKSFRSRQENFLDYDIYCKVIDECGKNVSFMLFMNYGESFLHPKAIEMISYAKKINPDMQIETSTNGIPFSNNNLAKKIIQSGINKITFTISGTNQKSYEKYHKNGKFQLAFQGLANTCLENNNKNVIIEWRYLLFNWNDSEKEIKKAIKLADELKNCQLTFHYSLEPFNARSYKLAPGNTDYYKVNNIVSFSHDVLKTLTIIPNNNGLYHLENNDNIGNFYWSSSKAELYYEIDKFNNIQIILCKNQDINKKIVNIVLPWRKTQFTISGNNWNTFNIKVPKIYRKKKIIKVIITTSVWFPQLENSSDDLRCLGIMIKDNFLKDFVPSDIS
ncbi:MAG: hypothetical protein A2086_14420 [Spirochaetes bacterium GWD1_27_9]|nr:MAG: hypothetical protein A2Z98_04560 [Spirochaetes bacterium GWB1_27_13]OHD26084.1 MAG: hypothetical protein A2Y34_03740 [Spirochaetes bacterium GWC1_27_15]OHD41251.1 MAG: hypothetical protein A2086_14420 [Spirochaetes bacterium GWD1_27_9]